MSTHEQTFADLDPVVQFQLLRLVRLVAAMTAAELAATDTIINIVRLSFASNLSGSADEYIPGAECISALGRIVTHQQKGA